MDVPRFIQLKAREEVLEIVRASTIVVAKRLVFPLVWLALPFFFMFALWRTGEWRESAFFAWVLSGAILVARGYFIWIRTVFVITDQRIIDFDQSGFFSREVTQATYDQIDEVSYEVNGFWATVLRYGKVLVRLDGASADIEINYVHNPSRIAETLNDVRAEKSAQSQTDGFE